MTASKEPFYFKFNTADWLNGTSGLSASERGVYITLLALIYDNDGPIFRDDGRLARKCGLPTMPFKRALEGLLSEGKLFVQDDGLLHNYRAKNEIATRQNSGVAKALAGSLGGKKTQEKQRAASSKAEAEIKLVIANSLELEEIDKSISLSIVNLPSAMPVPSEPGESLEIIKFKKQKTRQDADELLRCVGEAWNELANQFRLPAISKLTDKRKSWVVARAKELVSDYDYANPIDGFSFLFEKIKSSKFLRGEANGFRCDFDFAFNQTSFTKIMEGRYENN